MTTMRISQLAERSGVPATTLRYYESAGLLPADRTPSGYRAYGEDAVTRLAFIGSAKHLGLPLDEIGELLAVWETGACADVKADLRPRVAGRLAEAEHRLADLKAFTASLRSVLDRLDALPDRAEPCDAECGFPSDLPAPAEPAAAPSGGETAERCGDECGCSAVRGPEVAIVCSLSGEGMAERVAEWRAVVGGARPVEIPGGVRVTLPVEKAGAVAELAAAEQRCCPFFDFRLHLEGEAVHLEVRAPADASDLVNELFAP
jgi:DNA-binding transcriptional MerR regulator